MGHRIERRRITPVAAPAKRFRHVRYRRGSAGAGVGDPRPYGPARGTAMTAMPATGLSEVGMALCLVMILLVPLATLGLSLMHTGLGRSRSAAHTMLTALCMVATAALGYFAFGFFLQGGAR